MLELTINYGKGPISMSEISKNQNIPIKYLEQLIIPLKRDGLISSVRGPKGGHMLSKPPEKIYLWEVLKLLESKLSIVDCVSDETVCDHSAGCPIRPVWGKAFTAMMEVFNETSLCDVLNLFENTKESS
jgi:Rrf2 family protein